MNIVYIITKADEIGGAQIHVRDLSLAMTQLGHNVTVIVGEPGALTEQLNKNKINLIIEPKLIRNISPIKDLICVVKLRSILKKLSPDIVSLHSSKAGIIGRTALIGSKIPCIFTAHGWAFADGVSNKRKKLYILIEKLFSNFCEKIITVSHQDKNLAIKFNVATANKQIVIHNGMPDKSVEFPKKNNTSNIINIITVARFSEQKDHYSLLKALSNLPKSNWTLNLVGKGPLEPEIKKLASELKLSEKINFLGERHDVSNLLSLADIFILPSNWEGLPRSIIEAMSFSLPVIASDVGGVNEMVSLSNGFLIPRGDIHTMSKAILTLIENEETRISMGKKSRETYCNSFNFQKMLNRTHELYKTITGGNS
ncbi:glycosyltransferase family 4 protein [Providencia rettgeri]|nr:glycosyltransferase family 4 protein [Providencia rettgeri]EJD6644712.1 glycosyltransferase family 4 protein [Providencia rettgeri]ELL9154960.1 glycosyltransferase family 4 protein [Providencia rettgeri]ELR5050405.1 glycosyltransferase family 4 protein [Providencia rettgeri]ELR5063546.1 glycosyltransferase family 4 protein [Providencia rettgeri]